MSTVVEEVRHSTESRMGSLCPRCGSERVYRSRRRGALERVIAIVGARVRRCHHCNARFAQVANSTIRISDASVVAAKLGILALMAAGAVLVVALVAWLVARDAAPSQADPAASVLYRTGRLLG